MKPRIIFSHGNSFPASTYRVLFDSLRQRGFVVDAIEKFGHDPQYPVTNNWPHLVQQLADFARDKQHQHSTAHPGTTRPMDRFVPRDDGFFVNHTDNAPFNHTNSPPANFADNPPANLADNSPVTASAARQSMHADNAPFNHTDNSPANFADSPPAILANNSPVTASAAWQSMHADNAPFNHTDNSPANFAGSPPAILADNSHVTASAAWQSMHVSPQDQDRADEPAFLVGHSLGGILSLMCAARHPELVRGVLLIDSPVLGGWRATTLGLAKRTALVGALSPGRISQKRRHHWPDAESALESFQQKKSFARWDPQVLRDYIAHGTHDEGGQRVLSFDRDIETAIYNSLPHKLDSLLKRHPLKCPVAFIGGTQSAEMRQAGTDLTHQVVKGRVMMLDGSHLFPMEKPLATAAAIEASLRNMGA